MLTNFQILLPTDFAANFKQCCYAVLQYYIRRCGLLLYTKWHSLSVSLSQ